MAGCSVYSRLAGALWEWLLLTTVLANSANHRTPLPFYNNHPLKPQLEAARDHRNCSSPVKDNGDSLDPVMLFTAVYGAAAVHAPWLPLFLKGAAGSGTVCTFLSLSLSLSLPLSGVCTVSSARAV